MTGFVGAGYVGNFTSLTDLTNRFAPINYAGRTATLDNGTSVAWYFCDGTKWSQAGGSNSDFNLLPYATKMKLGGLGPAGAYLNTFSTAATGFTFQLQTTVEAEYDSVQIGVFNADTNAIAGVTATFLNPSQLQADNSSAANYNGATWLDATWNGGSTTGTLTAGISTFAPSITWTDVMAIQSVARADPGATLPLLQLRIGFPTSVNGTFCIGPGAASAGWESDNVATLNRPWRVRQQPVIAGTNATKAALTSTATSTAYWPPIIIRYFTRTGAVRQFFACGDSITEGYGATVTGGVGWLCYMQNTLSTKAAPVEVCNVGVGGSTSAQILTNASLFAPLVPGATMIHPNGTPNDTGSTITAANLVSWRGMKANLRRIASQNNMKSILWTMLPIRPDIKAWGATDSIRTGMNTEDLSSTGFKVWDFSTPMSGVISGGQYPLINTTDGTHPNDGGHVVMASVGVSQLQL